MSILVSVYCLAYNHEKYIRSALEGFVNQKTNFEYEVFVHDDASTDRTASIILEYAEKYPNIIKPIIQQENLYSKGINIFGIYIYPQMSGKYIATCEGDDYWCDEYKLQKQVDFLEKHTDYIACTHNSFIHNLKTGEKALVSARKHSGSIKLKDIVDWNNMFQSSSLIYRKSLREKEPVYMKSINGVGDYNLALWLKLNGKIHYIASPMSVYRYMAEGSWTSRNLDQDKNILDRIEMLKLFDKESQYKYKRLVKRKIDRLTIEMLYRNNEINKLHDMGYADMLSAGYIGIAVAVFLRLNNYKMYQMISELLYGKRSKESDKKDNG